LTSVSASQRHDAAIAAIFDLDRNEPSSTPIYRLDVARMLRGDLGQPQQLTQLSRAGSLHVESGSHPAEDQIDSARQTSTRPALSGRRGAGDNVQVACRPDAATLQRLVGRTRSVRTPAPTRQRLS
jgi:hypothetical protein